MTPQRQAGFAVALWPVVVTSAAVLLTLSFMHELPPQVATHWGTGGVADGFIPRESAPWVALIGLVMGWILGALVVALGGQDGIQRRLGVGVSAGIAAFVSGAMVATLWIQRGLNAGTEVGGADVSVTVALLVALAVGTLAGFTVPGPSGDATRATEPVPVDAPRAVVEDNESPRWTRTVAPARGVQLLFLAVALMFLILAVMADLWLFMLTLGVLVVGLGLGLSAFRVRVDVAGLTIRGLPGAPTWRVPLSDVAQTRVTTVNPLRDFGGWGYRLGLDGRTGFVVRAGEALEVTRGDGTRWVVTVDDAEAGAGLLNTLADRSRT